MRFVPFLAWARLRHRPARWLLVALGVAAATVLPVLAHNSASIVAAQAVRYGVAQLDPGQRSLIVTTFGVQRTPAELAKTNQEVRDQLAPLSDQAPRAELLFRRIADSAGGSFFFGAADHLGQAVRVTTGRLPTSCTPTRCEVVVMGSGTPDLDPSLGIVIVGRAVRTDPLLLTGTFDPGHDAPLLVADGVTAAAQIASLDQFPRTYGWVTPVDLRRVQHLGVDGYLARSAQVSENLLEYGTGLNLTAPDDILHAEDDRAQRSTRRFAVLGGAATALLLGFAALGAIGLRRDHGAVTELLRRRGARRTAIGLLTAIESGVPVLAGVVLGVLAGGLLAGWRGEHSDLPYWPAATAAARGAAPAVVLGGLAAWVIVAGVRAWPAAGRARTAWRAVDLAVLAGLAVVGLSLARGVVTESALSEHTDPLLPALPILFVACGGLLVARAWPALIGAAGRLVPHRLLGARLGLLGALRRPLRPVATAGFFAAATGIVVFAAAYQATLAQGAAEQATFTVPLSATVATGQNLARPLDVADASAYAATVPGTSVHPVLRTSAGIKVNASETLTADVLGVDPAALPAIPAWDHVVGGSDPTTARRRLTTTALQQGIPVPAGTKELAFPASGDLVDINITAWLRAADGRDLGLTLTQRGGQLVAPIPAGPLPQPVKLFAFGIVASTNYATIQQHHLGEGNHDVQILAGTVVLSGQFAGWGSDTATVTATGESLHIAYRFSGGRIVVRAGAAVPEAPVPVLADAATAAGAHNGLLPLAVEGNTPIQGKVVAVIPRFPTVGGRFVIVDSAALADALDARDPGTGSVTELWLSAPPGRSTALAAALQAAPYDQLRVDLRAAEESQLRDDPLARGAAGLLTTSALFALLVAALSVMLLVVAERRDESTELYAWESDGIPPGTLRRSLFARACAVVAVAVPGGLLIGLALSAVTTRLVTLTAVGSTPNPPLFLAIGPGWAAGALALGVLLGLGSAGIVCASALRERLPRRPEEELW